MPAANIGDTWEATGPEGERATITLSHRHGNGLEHWVWTFCLSDGSGCKRDWGPTYRSCKNEVGHLVGGALFKRKVNNGQG